MTTIINALKNIKGRQARVYIDHQLFGKQNICLKFQPETEIGLGFHCNDQIIYIEKNDVLGYNITDNEIAINGSLMNIKITLMD